MISGDSAMDGRTYIVTERERKKIRVSVFHEEGKRWKMLSK